MCGIVGVVNFSTPRDDTHRIVHKMLGLLSHRGPDLVGVSSSDDQYATFGHTLLSIVGRGSNRQPLTRGKYLLTFNGEIYNFLELRKQLVDIGYDFSTNSDTEVLLISYIHWKEECLTRLNGDFAFAIYDDLAHSVFLARDRVGVKPLFYTVTEDRKLIFASETKAILAHPDIKKSISANGLTEYLLSSRTLVNGCISSRNSVFEAVDQLPAGHYATFNQSGFFTKEYWQIPFMERSTKSHEELYGGIKHSLQEAVRIRVPKEVEFGTALSGGLDSSIVSYLTHQHTANVDCYSVRFSHGKNTDFEHADYFAKEGGLNLHEALISPDGQINTIDDLVHALDEPHDGLRQLGLLKIYKIMRTHGKKVALVGEGADEFNLGYYKTYPGYGDGQDIVKDVDDFSRILKDRIHNVESFLNPDFIRKANIKDLVDRCVQEDYANCPTTDPIDRMQYYYIKRFLPYRLSANDRLGMANGIEVRVPFCDHNVIAASLKVPHSINIQANTEKYLMRIAFKKELPDKILWRDKMPFPENSHKLMRQLLAKKLALEVNDAPTFVWDILNKEHTLLMLNIFSSNIESNKFKDEDIQLLQKDQVQANIKTVFLLITLIRWLRIYG